MLFIKSGLKLVCIVNIVYGNLQPENSQDNDQKPQRNCTFLNSASGVEKLVIFCWKRSLATRALTWLEFCPVGVGELLPAGPLEGLGGAVVLQTHVKVEPGLRYKSCDLGLLVSANI
jgi:hypothetical protein